MADWKGLLDDRGLTEAALHGLGKGAQALPGPTQPYEWHDLPPPSSAEIHLPSPVGAEAELAQAVLAQPLLALAQLPDSCQRWCAENLQAWQLSQMAAAARARAQQQQPGLKQEEGQCPYGARPATPAPDQALPPPPQPPVGVIPIVQEYTPADLKDLGRAAHATAFPAPSPADSFAAAAAGPSQAASAQDAGGLQPPLRWAGNAVADAAGRTRAAAAILTGRGAAATAPQRARIEGRADEDDDMALDSKPSSSSEEESEPAGEPDSDFEQQSPKRWRPRAQRSSGRSSNSRSRAKAGTGTPSGATHGAAAAGATMTSRLAEPGSGGKGTSGTSDVSISSVSGSQNNVSPTSTLDTAAALASRAPAAVPLKAEEPPSAQCAGAAASAGAAPSSAPAAERLAGARSFTRGARDLFRLTDDAVVVGVRTGDAKGRQMCRQRVHRAQLKLTRIGLGFFLPNCSSSHQQLGVCMARGWSCVHAQGCRPSRPRSSRQAGRSRSMPPASSSS